MGRVSDLAEGGVAGGRASVTQGKEVHQGRLRVGREEGEVRGLREAEEIQKVQKGGLQVEEERGEVPRQEVGVGPLR